MKPKQTDAHRDFFVENDTTAFKRISTKNNDKRNISYTIERWWRANSTNCSYNHWLIIHFLLKCNELWDRIVFCFASYGQKRLLLVFGVQHYSAKIKSLDTEAYIRVQTGAILLFSMKKTITVLCKSLTKILRSKHFSSPFPSKNPQISSGFIFWMLFFQSERN